MSDFKDDGETLHASGCVFCGVPLGNIYMETWHACLDCHLRLDTRAEYLRRVINTLATQPKGEGTEVKCPECGGAGSVMAGHNSPDAIDCRACGGSGHAPSAPLKSEDLPVSIRALLQRLDSELISDRKRFGFESSITLNSQERSSLHHFLRTADNYYRKLKGLPTVYPTSAAGTVAKREEEPDVITRWRKDLQLILRVPSNNRASAEVRNTKEAEEALAWLDRARLKAEEKPRITDRLRELAAAADAWRSDIDAMHDEGRPFRSWEERLRSAVIACENDFAQEASKQSEVDFIRHKFECEKAEVARLRAELAKMTADHDDMWRKAMQSSAELDKAKERIAELGDDVDACRVYERGFFRLIRIEDLQSENGDVMACAEKVRLRYLGWQEENARLAKELTRTTEIMSTALRDLDLSEKERERLAKELKDEETIHEPVDELIRAIAATRGNIPDNIKTAWAKLCNVIDACHPSPPAPQPPDLANLVIGPDFAARAKEADEAGRRAAEEIRLSAMPARPQARSSRAIPTRGSRTCRCTRAISQAGSCRRRAARGALGSSSEIGTGRSNGAESNRTRLSRRRGWPTFGSSPAIRSRRRACWTCLRLSVLSRRICETSGRREDRNARRGKHRPRLRALAHLLRPRERCLRRAARRRDGRARD